MPTYRAESIEVLQWFSTHAKIRLADGHLDLVPRSAILEDEAKPEENDRDKDELNYNVRRETAVEMEESAVARQDDPPAAAQPDQMPAMRRALDALWMKKQKLLHAKEPPPRVIRRRGNGGW